MSLNSPTEESVGPSGSGDSHDFSAIKERLETLEKENERLSALYTYVTATSLYFNALAESQQKARRGGFRRRDTCSESTGV